MFFIFSLRDQWPFSRSIANPPKERQEIEKTKAEAAAELEDIKTKNADAILKLAEQLAEAKEQHEDKMAKMTAELKKLEKEIADKKKELEEANNTSNNGENENGNK